MLGAESQVNGIPMLSAIAFNAEVVSFESYGFGGRSCNVHPLLVSFHALSEIFGPALISSVFPCRTRPKTSQALITRTDTAF